MKPQNPRKSSEKRDQIGQILGTGREVLTGALLESFEIHNDH